MTINKCHSSATLSLSVPLSLSFCLSLCLPVCALTKCNAAVKNDYFMAKNTHTQHTHTCSEKYLTDTHTHRHSWGLGVDTWEICSSSFAGVSRCSKTAPDKNCRRQTGVGSGVHKGEQGKGAVLDSTGSFGTNYAHTHTYNSLRNLHTHAMYLIDTCVLVALSLFLFFSLSLAHSGRQLNWPLPLFLALLVIRRQRCLNHFSICLWKSLWNLFKFIECVWRYSRHSLWVTVSGGSGIFGYIIK